VRSRAKFAFAAILAFASLALSSLSAAQATPQDDLKSVLDRLDAAAASFHSTSADVEVDDITTDPIYDKDVFKGVVYYDRKGSAFRYGVHFSQHNGRPSTKAYTFVGGVMYLRDSGSDEVKPYPQVGKFESYLLLGFGASGKELAAKWDIKYIGSENIGTVKTAILELVAKDPDIRKNLSKVTIWVDPDRAVSLKQVLTINATSSKVFLFSNSKLNQPLPGDAFSLK
jgi:outer membrane lipoprotein-sorting protein